MSGRLTLRLRLDGRIGAWRHDAKLGEVREGDGAESLLDAGVVAEASAAVLVPGAWVSLRRAVVPSRNDAQARLAAGFALEDELARDLDEEHIAVGPYDAGARLTAVIDRTRLRDALTALADLGVEPRAMVPEPLTLAPLTPSAAVVAVTPDAVVIGCGAEGGYALEPELAGELLDALLPVDQPVEIWSAPAAAPELDWGARTVANRALTPSDMLASQAEIAHSGEALNLLQGAFAPKTAMGAQVKAWAPAAALAAGVALLQLASVALEAQTLEREARAVEARAEARLREALPGVTRIVNPRAQLRAGLQSAQSGGGSAFLRQSAQLAEVVADFDGVEIDSLRFDADRNETAVTLLYDGFESIDAVREALVARGVPTKPGASRQRADKIAGDLTVGG